MKPVAAIAAFIAIGTDGVMDLDLVRRSRAAAQWAATSVHGRAWPHLVASGWRVELVTVRLAASLPDDDAGDRPGPARLGAALPPRPLVAAPRPPPPPPSPRAGRMKLLRAGEV